MLRLFAILLISGTLLAADEKNSAKLAAPEGWSGEDRHISVTNRQNRGLANHVAIGKELHLAGAAPV